MTTTRFAVLFPDYTSQWMEVHKAGCAHLNRRKYQPFRGLKAYWETEGESLTEAASDIASDFIAEGSMTVDEAVSQISWAPCLKGVPTS